MKKKDMPEKPNAEPASKFARSNSRTVGKNITVSTEAETGTPDSPDETVGNTPSRKVMDNAAGNPRSDTDSNTDSSPYGSQNGDGADWRNKHFRVNNLEQRLQEIMVRDPEKGAESSGGGGTPPPRGTGTSVDAQEPDEEPENPWSTHGGLPAVSNELNSEDSEQTEQSESFFYTDDGFDGPSPLYPDYLWKDLQAKGAPYFESETKSGDVKITGLNSCFFAGFTILCGNIHNQHGVWHAYLESKGCWKPLTKAELLNLVHFAVMHFEEKMQLPELEKFATKNFCLDVISFMVPICGYEDIFDYAPRNVINVKNGTIVIGRNGSIVLHDHSPFYLCRTRIEIDYHPSADYTGFVKEAFGSALAPADISTLQVVSGQIILGKNISQTISLLYGKAGCGKSTYIQFLEKMLPPGCYEGLRTGLLDTRFEIGRFENKNLLIAPDEASDALMKKGASKLKALSGADTLTTERKCENEHSMVRGEFNIVLISNRRPILLIDDDRDAWIRRLLAFEYKGIPPEKTVRNYAGKLFKKYSEAALNWAVDGAAELIRCGGNIKPHSEMVQRIDEIIQESDPVYAFVKTRVVPTGKKEDILFSYALYYRYMSTRTSAGATSKQSVQTALGKAMEEIHGAVKRKDLKDRYGKAKYGYVGYLLIKDDPE